MLQLLPRAGSERYPPTSKRIVVITVTILLHRGLPSGNVTLNWFCGGGCHTGRRDLLPIGVQRGTTTTLYST